MINLLNPEQQRQLRAARLNLHLLKFALLSIFIVIGVAGIYATGFWTVITSKASSEIEFSTAKKELDTYTATTQQAESYRQNLTVAKQIMGGEITFSSFLISLGTAMPSGTIIEQLSLSTHDITAKKADSIAIHTRAKSYADVLRIKQAFESSNLFSSVRIASTSTAALPDAKGIQAAYPYEARFEVFIKRTTQ